MRLPITPQLSTKDGVSNKNARLTNCLKESKKSGEKAVVRPGLVLDATASGVGNGLVRFNDELVSVYGATLGIGVSEGTSPVTEDIFNVSLDGVLTDSVGHVITPNGVDQGFTSTTTICGSETYSFNTVSETCTVTAESPDDFGVGTASFTLEAWVYPKNAVTQAVVFDRASNVSSDNFGLTVSGTEVLFGLVDDLGGSIQLASSGLSITNTWVHVAVVRDDDDVVLYVNGVYADSSVGGLDIDIIAFDVTDVDMYFGAGPCNLTNIQFMTGARYTEAFTPACVFSGAGNTIPALTTITGDFYDFAQSPI